MERICVICGKPVADEADLRDRFGVHHDIHATCWPSIARLTAERDEARASAAAAYERVAQAVAEWSPETFADCTSPAEAAEEIRALATEAETSALAEIVKKAVDAETRAGIEANRRAREQVIHSGEVRFIDGVRKGHDRAHDALTARLDQPKAESGE